LPGCAIPDLWKDPKYENIEDQPFFKESCELAHRWYEMGLINKTDLVGDPREQYLYAGKCAAYLENEPDYKYWDWQQGVRRAIPDATLKGYDMSGQRVGKIKRVRNLRQWNFVVFNALQPGDKRIAGIQFFNWLMGDQDNIDMWLFGIDGKNYKKEPNMRYSEIEGVDPTRNYRRMWYVSGCPGKVQRISIDLPKDAEETLKWLSTADNFRFNPYEGFLPETKPFETQLAQLNAANPEASHALQLGSIDVTEGIKAYKKALDAAGRQQLKAKFQEQLDNWIAKNIKQ